MKKLIIASLALVFLAGCPEEKANTADDKNDKKADTADSAKKKDDKKADEAKKKDEKKDEGGW